MATPLVTAIMPAFNAEETIAEAIESIRAQTFEDWELIIVDDASIDSTSEIAKYYVSIDSRVKLIQNSINLGRPLARNLAIAEAAGRFIAVADADDVSLPLRFERQVKRLEADKHLGAISCQLKSIDESGRQYGKSSRYPIGEYAISQRFREGKMALPNPCAMIRLDMFSRFGGYSKECLRGEDLEFFLRVYKDVPMDNLDGVLVHYRSSKLSSSLRSVLESGKFGMYAQYRANSIRDGIEPMSFAEFSLSRRQRATQFLGAVIIICRERYRRCKKCDRKRAP